MKIKDVALKANKASKRGSTSKSKINKQALRSKPKAIKQVQEQVETTSSSSEDENDDEHYEKVDDVALFMKRFQKGTKEARLQGSEEKVFKQEEENMLQLW